MKELLIKIRSLFSGGGFQKAGAELDQVKNKASEAAKVSKGAMDRIADAAYGLARAFGAVLAGFAIGKMLSKPFDALRGGVEAASESMRNFGRNYAAAANATTLDAAIREFEQLRGAADALDQQVKELNKSWVNWAANALMGGKPLAEMTAAAKSMRLGAYMALAGAAAQQADMAGKIAEDPTNAERVDELRLQAKREREIEALNQRREEASDPNERVAAENAIYFTRQRYAAEDVARTKIAQDKDAKSIASASAEAEKENEKARQNAETLSKKRAELELELRIAEARAAGDEAAERRLIWQRDYNRMLEEARAAQMADPEAYAQRAATAAQRKEKEGVKETPVGIGARVEGGAQTAQMAGFAREAMRAAEMAKADKPMEKVAENTSKLVQQNAELKRLLERREEGAFV